MPKLQPSVRAFTLLLSSLLLVASPADAQSFSPPKIVFVGAPDLQPADLIALTGLTPGKPLTEPDIDKAMQQLVDTGLFADIHYTVDGRALTFKLTPQPAANMVPVVYGNFVLWKPEELAPLLHAKVPLFTGSVPTSGNFQQTIADALTAILEDRGIKGHVEGLLTGSKAVVYSITDPVVQIHQVRVDSVSTVAAPKISAMLQSFAATEYDRHSAAAIQQRLQETYLDLAFLDVTIDPPVRSQPTVTPNAILVDYTTAAHEGAQYHISKFDWPASPIVPRPDFERDIPLRAGDPASRIEVLSATKRSEAEFTRHGYLDARVTVHDAKDSAAHTIAYTLTVEPGEQYHLASVHTFGFTADQQKDFDKNWKLAAGAVYDPGYVFTFFPRDTKIASFQGFQPKFDEHPDRNAHTVELTISLVKRAAPPSH